jgi:antitoxin component YwqK of YwqJK toxin-antitoxin module
MKVLSVIRYLIFLTLMVAGTAASAQEVQEENTAPPPPGEPMFYRDSVPELNLDDIQKKEEEPKKKVKKPKKTFYGLKCRKSFTRKGAGKKQELEMFYYLRKPADPDFYVQDVYVYDMQKQQVIEISKKEKFDPRFHKILHGPYKRTVNGSVVEQGIFYIGTKHGRWETYTVEKTDEYNGEEITFNTLLEKKKYYKGWPRDTRVTYYDHERKKVKEVYPYEGGKLNGTYFYFLENGQVFKRGKYADGKKIGIWVEYFKDRARVAKEVQYPDTPYETAKPYILNQWDDKNNQIVANGKKVEPGQQVETDPLKKMFKKKKN